MPLARSPGSARLVDLATGGALGGSLFGAFLRDCRPVADELAPGTRIGPWQILRPFGSGGTATVYLAERADGAFQMEVAIKLVRDDPALHDRLRNERDILGKLRHPGIARLIDAGELPDGRVWMAMEPVFGERIHRYVESHALGWRERLVLLEKVCDAVSYAHSRLLVHRDIKSANVLVDEHGQPKLLDFGIALSDGDDSLELVDRPMTINVASPEQLAGGAITTASDVYQLGLLIDRTLHASGAYAGARRLPRSVAADIQAVVDRATADDSLGRYGTVEALQRDLARLRVRRPVSVRPGAAIAAARFVERNWRAVAVALLILATCAGGLVISFQRLIAERQAAGAAAVRAHTVTQFMAGMFRNTGDGGAEKQMAIDFIESGVRRMDQDLHRQPQVRALFAATAGRLLSETGQWERAREVFEDGLAHARTTLSPDAYELAALLAEFGWHYVLRAQYDAAQPYLQEAIRILEPPRTDAERLMLARASSSSGVAHMQNGDLAAAGPLLERALSLAQSVEIGETGELAAAHNNLAMYRRREGKLNTALQHYRAAAEIAERLNGPYDSAVVDARNNAGVVLRRLDRLVEARELQLQALDILHRVGGADSISAARTLTNLAEIAFDLGHAQECVEHAQESARITAAASGDEHPNLQYPYSALIRCLIATDRPTEALAVAQKMYATITPRFAPDKREHLQATSLLAQAELAAGNRAAAVVRLTSVVAAFVRQPSFDRWDLVEPAAALEAACAAQVLDGCTTSDLAQARAQLSVHPVIAARFDVARARWRIRVSSAPATSERNLPLGQYPEAMRPTGAVALSMPRVTTP